MANDKNETRRRSPSLESGFLKNVQAVIGIAPMKVSRGRGKLGQKTRDDLLSTAMDHFANENLMDLACAYSTGSGTQICKRSKSMGLLGLNWIWNLATAMRFGSDVPERCARLSSGSRCCTAGSLHICFTYPHSCTPNSHSLHILNELLCFRAARCATHRFSPRISHLVTYFQRIF